MKWGVADCLKAKTGRERGQARTLLPRRELLDRLFRLRRDSVRVRLVDIIGNALHAILEAAKPLAESFAELRQLLAPEKHENDYCENDEMSWLK